MNTKDRRCLLGSGRGYNPKKRNVICTIYMQPGGGIRNAHRPTGGGGEIQGPGRGQGQAGWAVVDGNDFTSCIHSLAVYLLPYYIYPGLFCTVL